jgi:tripartite-type tricarboxylate transporter receptor subunit TctC
MSDSVRRKLIASTALASLGASLGLRGALAQSIYPNRPIHLVCPFAPGGVADQVARIVAGELSKRLGQSVVVDNRSGAAGNIGSQLVATSAPDGYTMLLGLDSTLAANPHVYRRMPFDSVKDFAPVGMIGDVPLMVVANPALKAHSIAEMVEVSKATPQGLSYGTPGIGSTQHLMFELIRGRTGANLVHVPYRGAAPALVDTMGGSIPLVGAALAGALEYIKAGKLKALAISSARRSTYLPEVPTLIESGFKDMVITTWHALLLPASTPSAIVQTVNTALNASLNDPLVRQRLDSIGSIAAPTTPAGFAQRLSHDLVVYGELVKAAKIEAID